MDTWILTGEQATAYEQIDEALCRLARALWQAEAVILPSSVPMALLEELGYTDRFRGHLTLSHALANPEAAMGLVPAACLPLYPEIKQQNLQDPRCYTSRVKVFRYEDGLRAPGRLWEFNVREIIFVGSPEFVKGALSDLGTEASQVLASHGIPTTLVTASDHFTTTDRRTQVLKRLQLENASKLEWIVDRHEGQLALGSVNYHGDRFSRHFGWDKSGTVVSGCVGFGLERCTLALAGDKRR